MEKRQKKGDADVPVSAIHPTGLHFYARCLSLCSIFTGPLIQMVFLSRGAKSEISALEI